MAEGFDKAQAASDLKLLLNVDGSRSKEGQQNVGDSKKKKKPKKLKDPDTAEGIAGNQSQRGYKNQPLAVQNTNSNGNASFSLNVGYAASLPDSTEGKQSSSNAGASGKGFKAKKDKRRGDKAENINDNRPPSFASAQEKFDNSPRPSSAKDMHVTKSVDDGNRKKSAESKVCKTTLAKRAGDPPETPDSSVGQRETGKNSGIRRDATPGPSTPGPSSHNVKQSEEKGAFKKQGEASTGDAESKMSNVNNIKPRPVKLGEEDLSPEFLKKLEVNRMHLLKKKNQRFPKAKFFCRLCDFHLDSKEECYKHVLDNRHCRRKEISDVDTILKSMPEPTDRQIQAITSAVEKVYEEQGIDEWEQKQRADIVNRLEKLLKESIPDVLMFMYGSSLTGFGLKKADINVDLNSTEKDKKLTQLLREVYQSLKDKTDIGFSNIHSDFSAKVPGLLMMDDVTGNTVNVTIHCYGAHCSSELLAIYSDFDMRVRKLVVAFRYWAHLCGLDRQSDGFIPPQALNLMVIFFLQEINPQVVPIITPPKITGEDVGDFRKDAPLFEKMRGKVINSSALSKNHMSIGQLWLKLLRFYSLEFDASNIVVSIRNETNLTRNTKPWNSKKLAVQDPYMVKKNITRMVNNSRIYEYWQDSIRKAFHYFGLPRDSKGKPLISVENLKEALDLHQKQETSANEEKKKEMEAADDVSEADRNEEIGNDADGKEAADDVSEADRNEEIGNDADRKEASGDVSGTDGEEAVDDVSEKHKKVLESSLHQNEKEKSDATEIAEVEAMDIDDLDDCVVIALNPLLQKPLTSKRPPTLPNKSRNDTLQILQDIDALSLNQPLDIINYPSSDPVNHSTSDVPSHVQDNSDQMQCSLSLITQNSQEASLIKPHVLLDKTNDTSRANLYNTLDLCQNGDLSSESAGSQQSTPITKEHKLVGSSAFISTTSVSSTQPDIVVCAKVDDEQKTTSGEEPASGSEEDKTKNLFLELEEKDYVYEFTQNFLTDGKGPTLVCTYCEKEGHLKNACPEDELPEILPLHNLTPAHLKILSDTLSKLPSEVGLSDVSLAERQLFLKTLEEYIRMQFPDAHLALFGSSCNGFGFDKSDIDICLTFSQRKLTDKIWVIETLARRLKQYSELANVQAIPTAKVPIVKFTVKRTNLEGDISLYNTLAQQNTKLLYCYCQIDPRVRILGYTIKTFAKVCDIGDASRGSLSSYAYILMMLYYLQQVNPPVIPVLQEMHEEEETPKLMVEGWNAWFMDDLSKLDKMWPEKGTNKMSVAELWLGFLRFYVEEFNHKEYVVSIRQKEALTRFDKLWNGSSIAVEDPFDLSHNLGSGLTRKMNNFIFKTFINGRMLYGSPVDENMEMFMKYQTPSDYFFDTDLLSENRPPNVRGCRRCGKIGHLVRHCPTTRKEKEDEQKRQQQQQQQQQKPPPQQHQRQPQQTQQQQKLPPLLQSQHRPAHQQQHPQQHHISPQQQQQQQEQRQLSPHQQQGQKQQQHKEKDMRERDRRERHRWQNGPAGNINRNSSAPSGSSMPYSFVESPPLLLPPQQPPPPPPPPLLPLNPALIQLAPHILAAATSSSQANQPPIFLGHPNLQPVTPAQLRGGPQHSQVYHNTSYQPSFHHQHQQQQQPLSQPHRGLGNGGANLQGYPMHHLMSSPRPPINYSSPPPHPSNYFYSQPPPQRYPSMHSQGNSSARSLQPQSGGGYSGHGSAGSHDTHAMPPMVQNLFDSARRQQLDPGSIQPHRKK